MNTLRLYISGPLTRGNWMTNTNAACVAFVQAMEDGFVPFCPHWSVVQDLVAPLDYEDWLEYDFAWLAVCDALWRLPGESAGGDREVAKARRLGIPVFEDYAALLAWKTAIEKGEAAKRLKLVR